MHRIGLLLITLGFLGGSLIAVLDPEAIDWTMFAPFLVLGVAGVVLVQWAIRREAADPVRAQANFAVLHKSLDAIVDGLVTLERDKEALDVYALPERIDQTFREPINAFVDARESIAHTAGVQAYADIMSHFAAGERYLNRVWSCAADGYIDEAHAYVTRSHEQFEAALSRLRGLERALEKPAAGTGTDEAGGLPEARVVAPKST